MKYRTFKRSARNFEEFSMAKKVADQNGLTLEEARSRCKQWNENRTTAQIAAGTKMEFEQT